MINLKPLQQLNKGTARETAVYVNGNTVLCTPGPMAPADTVWLEKQMLAGILGKQIRNKNNAAYFVPALIGVDDDGNGRPVTIQERAPGRMIDAAYFQTLSPADHVVIYDALANFINDMAHVDTIRTQSAMLDEKRPFDESVGAMFERLTAAEIDTVRGAKTWFDRVAKNDASYILSHADMNPGNILYDASTKTVSFLDLVEARYMVADQVLKDFQKLPWLDVAHLRSKIEKLPGAKQIVFDVNPTLVNMRNALNNFKWSANWFIDNPNANPAQINLKTKILKTQVADIKTLLKEAAIQTVKNNRAMGNAALRGRS